jgi:uncharacterized membrane protein
MAQNKDTDLRAKKRNKFVQSKPKRKRSPTVWLLGGGAVLIVVLLGWRLRENTTTSAAQVKAGELPAVQDGAYRLPTAHFDGGKALFYAHETGGKTIQFFVLKSRDGVIRAAFNACDVCYLDKQGYRQEGDEMVCNACGQRFPSELINEVRGGCNPSPLERTIQGDEVIILVEDIVAGANYF